MREDLESSTRDDLAGPVFPYPHLKATLTSWESRLDVAGAPKDEIVEDAREMLRLVPSTRGPRAFRSSVFRGGEATAALVRPSSRGLLIGAVRIPSSAGEEQTVAAMRPFSQGPRVLPTPGSGGKEQCRNYGLNNATVFARAWGDTRTRLSSVQRTCRTYAPNYGNVFAGTRNDMRTWFSR